MAFFDLNIPFPSAGPDTAVQKKNQIRLVVKAMELGYAGIAYNQTVRGAMSDSDRCCIHPLPLSSLLKAAPALSTSVRFHRSLLQSSVDAPFRQYNRITVAVEAAIHAAALNSGNPVLKTYDLVAVQPLNQMTFDQACKVSEVDLISINFSQKMPFRLKLPLVKTAIERGIYFEIAYSPLISDVQARRNMLSGAKILVDWTRGKNIILSSGALIGSELRGPCDVANLAFLLGLSMERAKAALSKNCRALITSSLRKKQFYKEAIKVERISSTKVLDSFTWDPISSGNGDLSMSDIDNSLAVSSKEITDASKNPLQSLDASSSFLLPRQLVTAAFTESIKLLNVVDECIVLEGPMKITSEVQVSDTRMDLCEDQLDLNRISESGAELLQELRPMVCSGEVNGSDNDNMCHNEVREPLICADSSIHISQGKNLKSDSSNKYANMSLRNDVILAPCGINFDKNSDVSALCNEDFHMLMENISSPTLDTLTGEIGVSNSASKGLDVLNISSGIHDVSFATDVGDQNADEKVAHPLVDRSVAKDICVTGVQKNEGTVGNKSMTADLCIQSLEQSDPFVETVIVDQDAERLKHNYATSVHDLADGCMTGNEAHTVLASNLRRTDDFTNKENWESINMMKRVGELTENACLRRQDLDCKTSDLSVHGETLKHDEVSRLVNKLLLGGVTSDTVEVLSHTIPDLSVHTAAQNRHDSIALVDKCVPSDRKGGKGRLKRKSRHSASLFPSRTFLRNMHFGKKRRK